MILNKNYLDYDAALLWVITTRCNLNCAYCVRNLRKKNLKARLFTLRKRIVKGCKMNISVMGRLFCYELIEKTKKIPKINTPALIKTLNETGKTFLINLTGGEPFLVPNIIEACAEITKKHYITFFTNLTNERVREFAEKINPERVGDITASLHIKELEKLNLVNKYINNFLLFKRKRFNISAKVVAYPPLLNEIKKYKKVFKENGVDMSFLPFLGYVKGERRPYLYTKEELEVFSLNREDIHLKRQQGELCNAGYNTGIVYPSGDIQRCYGLTENIGNIYKEIKFKNTLVRCPVRFCECPFNKLYSGLFSKAIGKFK